MNCAITYSLLLLVYDYHQKFQVISLSELNGGKISGLYWHFSKSFWKNRRNKINIWVDENY